MEEIIKQNKKNADNEKTNDKKSTVTVADSATTTEKTDASLPKEDGTNKPQAQTTPKGFPPNVVKLKSDDIMIAADAAKIKKNNKANGFFIATFVIGTIALAISLTFLIANISTVFKPTNFDETGKFLGMGWDVLLLLFFFPLNIISGVASTILLGISLKIKPKKLQIVAIILFVLAVLAIALFGGLLLFINLA